MLNERFAPVAHDAAFVAEMLKDKKTKHAYEALEEEYTALGQTTALY